MDRLTDACFSHHLIARRVKRSLPWPCLLETICTIHNRHFFKRLWGHAQLKSIPVKVNFLLSECCFKLKFIAFTSLLRHAYLSKISFSTICSVAKAENSFNLHFLSHTLKNAAFWHYKLRWTRLTNLFNMISTCTMHSPD